MEMMNILRMKGDWCLHLLAWLAGVLCALCPFIHAWELIPYMPFRLGNGQFGFNLIIVSFLFLLGGVLGGYWWRCCRWLVGSSSVGLGVFVGVWFCFSLLVAVGLFGQYVYQYGSVLILLGGIVYAFVRRSGGVGFSDGVWGSLVAWLRVRFCCNVFYFVLFWLVVWGNNVMALLKLDLSVWEMVSAVVGRFFFTGFLAVLLFLIAELCMRASPVRMRWCAWLVLACLPVLVIFDTLQTQVYGRSVLEVVNNLTSNGSINVEKELAAGGFSDVGVVFLLSCLVVVYVLMCCVVHVLRFYSGKLRWRASFISGIVLLVVFYGLAVGEKALGVAWKSMSSRQQVYKAFMLHQGVVKPKLGLADFAVEFRDVAFRPGNRVVRPKSALPDIYIFMVESMRYDSMDSRTTPFLMEMRRDCQDLRGTWASSNATHLSWYSMFYSKPAVFWKQELGGIEDKGNFRGSPLLNELKSMGYSLDVRVVCSLDYKEFGLLNFGSEGALCDVLEQVEDGNELDETDTPGREKIIFKRLRDSITNSSEAGGHFFFTGLDSPHYNYYWHDDFKVPYADYKGDISFPLFPSKQEVRLYRNRYLNSVAWVDYQLREFCEFLKREGRYDNSIIVITGDHGEEFQERGGWCHCTSLMPEQTEVPILIKWPAGVKDVPRRELANHVDILPSVLSYLGASEETMKSMNGVDLLSKVEENTVLVSTAFANKDGETMMLKRGGYTAYFSWDRPWEPRVPTVMRLERITGADGKLIKLKGVDYEAKLRELFPDAYERHFKSLKEIR